MKKLVILLIFAYIAMNILAEPIKNEIAGSLLLHNIDNVSKIVLDGKIIKNDQRLHLLSPQISHDISITLENSKIINFDFFIKQDQALAISFNEKENFTYENHLGIPLSFIKPGQVSYQENENSEARDIDLTNALYVSKYEITNAEYEMYDPHHNKYRDKYSMDDDQPVLMVSWYDAVKFCNWLSEKEKLQKAYDENNKINIHATGYRLLTNSEWEYIAKSGAKTLKGPRGTTLLDANDNPQANYYNSKHKNFDGYKYTAPVGSFPENSLGVSDLLGNVAEWCNDWYDINYLENIADNNNSTIQNPTGPDEGSERLIRGGGWSTTYKDLTIYNKSSYHPSNKNQYIGFRICRSVDMIKIKKERINIPFKGLANNLKYFRDAEFLYEILKTLKSKYKLNHSVIFTHSFVGLYKYYDKNLDNVFSFLDHILSILKKNQIDIFFKKVLPNFLAASSIRLDEIPDFLIVSDLKFLPEMILSFKKHHFKNEEIALLLKGMTKLDKYHVRSIFKNSYKLLEILKRNNVSNSDIIKFFQFITSSKCSWVYMNSFPEKFLSNEFDITVLNDLLKAYENIFLNDFNFNPRIYQTFYENVLPHFEELFSQDNIHNFTDFIKKFINSFNKDNSTLILLFLNLKKIVEDNENTVNSSLEEDEEEDTRLFNVSFSKIIYHFRTSFFNKKTVDHIIENKRIINSTFEYFDSKFSHGSQSSSDIINFKPIDKIRDIRIPLENKFDSLLLKSGKTKCGIIQSKGKDSVSLKEFFIDTISGKIFGSEVNKYELSEVEKINHILTFKEKFYYNKILEPNYTLGKELDLQINSSEVNNYELIVESQNVVLKGMVNDEFIKEALYLLELVIKGYQLFFESDPQKLLNKIKVYFIATPNAYALYTNSLLGKEILNPALFIPRINIAIVLNPHSLYEEVLDEAINEAEDAIQINRKISNNLSSTNRYKLRIQKFIDKQEINLRSDKRKIENALQQFKKNIFKTLFHECFHYYLEQIAKNTWKVKEIPVWIHEGFAMFFEVSEFEGNEFLIGGINSDAVDFIYTDYMENGFLPITKLLDSKSEDYLVETFEQNDIIKSQRRYYYSWALIHFLTKKINLEKSNKLSVFLQDSQNFKDPKYSFELLIGMPIDIFEDEWHDYIINYLIKKKYSI